MAALVDPFDAPQAAPQHRSQAPGGLVDPFDEPVQFAERAASMSPMDLSVARSRNDAFGAYLREQAQQRKPGETDEAMARRQFGSLSGTGRPGAGEGMTRGALQGLTFGAGDEIVAGGTAALDATLRGEDFGRAYDARLGRERQKISQFREDSPVLAYGSEIAGAIPTAVATAPTAAGASLAGRAGIGAGTGAAQGFGYGLFAGEGGAAERAQSGVISAGIGGTIGATAPAIGAGARAMMQRIQSGRNAAALGIPRRAADVLTRVASADDLFSQGAQRIARGGPDAMLADAGPNMRTLLDTAMQKSGPAATAARRAIEDRATGAGRGVTEALDDSLGRPGESSSRALTVYGDKTNPLDLIYRRAYSRPIDYASEAGRKIEDIILNRVPAAAIRAANELMRIEGRQSQHILADIADDGAVTFRSLPDVRQIDYITRGLNEVADRADGLGKMGGTTQTGRAYANLSRELRSTLKELVPEYKQALDTAAGLIREGKAKEFGGVLLSARTTRADVADMVSDMGAAEKRKVAEGLRVFIDDSLANVKRALTDSNMDAREAIKALKELSSRASREKVSSVIGEQQAARLFGELDRSTAAFELRAAVADNSRTFARTAMDDVVGRADAGVMDALRMGRPAEAFKRGVQNVTGRSAAARERLTDETYSALAEVLTGPRGPQAANIVRALEAGQQRSGPTVERARLLAELLARRNVGVTGPAAQGLLSE